jgi:hypothetical protein
VSPFSLFRLGIVTIEMLFEEVFGGFLLEDREPLTKSRTRSSFYSRSLGAHGVEKARLCVPKVLTRLIS